MKHTLLLGENSALFIEENKLFNKKTIKFDEICNLGIDDVRILSNRADFEFKIGFLPKVYFWQSNLVLKSYIVGHTFPGTFFNSQVHKNTLDVDKYKTQDVMLSPDDVTKNIIDQMAGKSAYGIEHMALIIPKIINSSKYWIFISENLLGKYSIYCGKENFVLFVRSVENNLPSQITKTTEFLERFGFKNGDEIDKFSIMQEPMDGFKNLYKGYGDEYLIARVFEQEELAPVVGPKTWVRPSCYNCRCGVKLLGISCIIMIIALLISNIMNYREYADIERSIIKFSPKLLTISNDTAELLMQTRHNLRDEINEFDFLDDEFRHFQSAVDDAILYDRPQEIDSHHMRKRPRHLHIAAKIINSTFSPSKMEEIKYLFPKNLNVISYTYESSIKNGKEHCNVSIYTNSSDEIISEFIQNVKANAPWAKKISVDKKNPSGKIITISKK